MILIPIKIIILPIIVQPTEPSKHSIQKHLALSLLLLLCFSIVHGLVVLVFNLLVSFKKEKRKNLVAGHLRIRWATKILNFGSRRRNGATKDVYDNTLLTAPSQWADLQATQRLTNCGMVHTGQQISCIWVIRPLM